MEECREDLREYLKAHPEPIASPDLLKAVMALSVSQKKAQSSYEYGDSSGLITTRREAYMSVLWSMRANGEVWTRNRTLLQCWHEHVPEDDRSNWWEGID